LLLADTSAWIGVQDDSGDNQCHGSHLCLSALL